MLITLTQLLLRLKLFKKLDASIDDIIEYFETLEVKE